jgi:hypothetical protein
MACLAFTPHLFFRHKGRFLLDKRTKEHKIGGGVQIIV